MVQSKSMTWHEAAAVKKASDAERIPVDWRLPANAYKDLKNVMSVPTTCGILSPREIKITELDNVELLLKYMASGEWSAEEVATAFCKRAAIAHQLTNCLSEFWFDDAIARAKELDQIRQGSGPIGALHGLPISLKDQFQIAGKECNMCWASWIGRISTENSTLVDSLVSAGAIIFTRTNMAQGAWFPEGDNNVYGRADNPFYRDRVTGGSSAGEGPLGILKGSAVGVGTDIGGSVRIPATFNSLFGLRPTARRFPYGRALNTLMGQENVESCLGPMCSNLAGCVAFTRGVLGTAPWKADAGVVPLPWKEEDYLLTKLGGHDGAKLCIGVYDFDGEVHVHPPFKRAMKSMVEALKLAGHEVIPWKPTASAEMGDLIMNIFNADGGDDLRDVVQETGEPVLPQVVVDTDGGVSVFETYQYNRAKSAFRNQLLRQWQDTVKETSTGRPIDAVLCPVVSYTAPPHGQSKYIKYSSIYNLLDWPALAIPVTFVDPAVDPVDAGYEALSEMDQTCKDLWDVSASAGMPIGLQLVGQKFQEETLLGVAEVVMKAYTTAGYSYKL